MKLQGKKVAVLVADLFEDSEFIYPYYRMQEEGASVVTVGVSTEATYTGKHGVPVHADVTADSIRAEDFDAVIIPGGYSPDHMRRSPEMVHFVKQMDGHSRVIAAICHAGWMLATADIVRGRRVTSFFSIKDDMINAGAEWLDEEVVMDRHLITSRFPGDLPAFCRTIISAMA